MSENILRLGIDPTSMAEGASQARSDLDRVRAASASLDSAIDRLERVIANLGRNLQLLSKSLAANSETAKQAQVAYTTTGASLRLVTDASAQAERNLSRLQEQVSKSSNSFDRMKALVAQSGTSFGAMHAPVSAVSNTVGGLTDKLYKVQGTVVGVSSAAGAMSGSFANIAATLSGTQKSLLSSSEAAAAVGLSMTAAGKAAETSTSWLGRLQTSLFSVAQAWRTKLLATKESNAENERTPNVIGQAITAYGTLKSTILGVASAFALWKVYDYLKDSALLAARFETLGVVMTVVGKNAGYNSVEMENFAKSVQKMGITMSESRDSVIKMAQAELDLTKASQLARVAQDAAVIGGVNSSEALNRIVHGIRSQQVEVLRTIGINILLDESYKKYAKSIGVASGELSAAQKVQATMNAVLEYGTKIAGAYEASMGTAGKQLTSLARYAEDAKTKLGEVFNEVLLAGVAGYTAHLKNVNGELDELAKNNSLKQWGEEMTNILASLGDSIANLLLAIKGISSTVASVVVRYQTYRTFIEEIKGVKDPELRRQARERYDASMAANRQQLSDTYEELANAESPFQRGLAQLRAARKSDADRVAANSDEYLKRQAEVQAAYASYPVDVQQKAQMALAKSYFPDQYPLKPVRTAEREQKGSKGKSPLEEQQEFVERFRTNLQERAYQGETPEVQELVRRETDLQRIEKDNAKLRLPLSKEIVASMQSELRAVYDLIDAGKERQRQTKLSMEEAEELERDRQEALKRQVEESNQLVQIQSSASRRVDDLKFEVEMIGKTADEQRRLTEFRNIDLMVQEKSIGKSTEFKATLESLAETMKERVAKALDAMREKQESWVTGAEAALRKYEELAKNVAANTEAAFTSAFKKTEDVITEALTKGRFDLKEFLSYIHTEFTRQMVREDIMPVITGWVRGNLSSIAKIMGKDPETGQKIQGDGILDTIAKRGEVGREGLAELFGFGKKKETSAEMASLPAAAATGESRGVLDRVFDFFKPKTSTARPANDDDLYGMLDKHGVTPFFPREVAEKLKGTVFPRPLPDVPPLPKPVSFPATTTPLPELRIPEIEIKTPEITLPDITGPEIGQIDLEDAGSTFSDLVAEAATGFRDAVDGASGLLADELTSVVKSISLPEIDFPSPPGFPALPEISLPELPQFGALPAFEMPRFDFSEASDLFYDTVATSGDLWLSDVSSSGDLLTTIFARLSQQLNDVDFSDLIDFNFDDFSLPEFPELPSFTLPSTPELSYIDADRLMSSGELFLSSVNESTTMLSSSINEASSLFVVGADSAAGQFTELISSSGDVFSDLVRGSGNQFADLISNSGDLLSSLLSNIGGGSGGGLGGLFGGGGGVFDFFDDAVGVIAGLFDKGGIIGKGTPLGGSRVVPLSEFKGARRMQYGGIIGDGIPIIGHPGEEVLTPRDPRHRNNFRPEHTPRTTNNNVQHNIYHINVPDSMSKTASERLLARLQAQSSRSAQRNN